MHGTLAFTVNKNGHMSLDESYNVEHTLNQSKRKRSEGHPLRMPQPTKHTCSIDLDCGSLQTRAGILHDNAKARRSRMMFVDVDEHEARTEFTFRSTEEPPFVLPN